MTSEAVLSSWVGPWTGLDASVDGQIGSGMEADAALAERCVQGDGDAWEALVRSHTRLIYGACYRFLGQPDTARDVTQEVFLRVFRNLHTYDPASGTFRTWLLRLTRNLLIDHYRKNQKHRILDSLDDRTSAMAETKSVGGRADHLLASREAGELLSRALQELSVELREAVVLRDLQGMDYREIAAVLQVPEGTVKSRINRGRREIARYLRTLGVRL